MTVVTHTGEKWQVFLEDIRQGKEGKLKGNVSAFKDEDIDDNYTEQVVDLPDEVVLHEGELRIVNEHEPEAYQGGMHERHAITAGKVLGAMGVAAISGVAVFEYYRHHKH